MTRGSRGTAQDLVPSRYNVVSHPVGNRVVVFNTLTQNAAIFDRDEWALITSSPSHADAFSMGFIVERGADERGIAIRLRSELKRIGKSGLSVTIVPSVGCNFSCGYCYNGIHGAKTVSGRPKSLESSIQYADRNLEHGSSLRVTWYGGEPLLFQKNIEDWSRPLQEIASARGCSYEADILTNGAAITAATPGVLERSGIRHVQVSIDWPPAESGRRMGTMTAEQTLDLVLRKIDLIPEDIGLTIRINTFPGFLADFPRLVGDIRGKVKRNVSVYCHRIYESSDDGLNDDSSKVFRYRSSKEYSRDYLSAKAILREAGYHQDYFPSRLIDAVCIAQSASGVIANAEGEFRKCPREIVGEGAVSKIDNTGNEVLEAYRSFDASLGEECSKCTFLPICHGGCVKEAVNDPSSTVSRCTLWKFTMVDELTSFLRAESQGSSHEEGEGYDRG